ncbi:MAG: hypothetical protein MJE68_21010 [Proteobacteria bacterium]|nr:hypothetical protein [Pseudomonadota bacterium]
MHRRRSHQLQVCRLLAAQKVIYVVLSHLLSRVKSLSLRNDLKDPVTGEWLAPLPEEMKRMMYE